MQFTVVPGRKASLKAKMIRLARIRKRVRPAFHSVRLRVNPEGHGKERSLYFARRRDTWLLREIIIISSFITGIIEEFHEDSHQSNDRAYYGTAEM